MAAKSKQAEAPEAVAIHYVGDGDHYVIGITTDPSVTTEVDPERAAELLATGLFAEGPAPVIETPVAPAQE